MEEVPISYSLSSLWIAWYHVYICEWPIKVTFNFKPCVISRRLTKITLRNVKHPLNAWKIWICCKAEPLCRVVLLCMKFKFPDCKIINQSWLLWYLFPYIRPHYIYTSILWYKWLAYVSRNSYQVLKVSQNSSFPECSFNYFSKMLIKLLFFSWKW